MARLKRVEAWGRSVAAYTFVCAYVGVLGPPALLIALLTGRTEPIFVLGQFCARTARRIFGLRFQVEGLDSVDGTRPAVYCINHCSNVDVIVFEVLYPRCRSLRAVYKAELGSLPVLGRVLRAAGFVPVHRGVREQTVAAIETAAARLEAGGSFVLAPEGTRGTGPGLGRFKNGAFVMAIKAQVPVVPVALLGTAAAMPRGQWYVTPSAIRVRIGAPIPTAGLTMHQRAALADRVRTAIEALLAQE